MRTRLARLSASALSSSAFKDRSRFKGFGELGCSPERIFTRATRFFRGGRSRVQSLQSAQPLRSQRRALGPVDRLVELGQQAFPVAVQRPLEYQPVRCMVGAEYRVVEFQRLDEQAHF